MSNIPSTINIPKLLVEQTIEYKVYQSFVSSIKLLPLRKLLEIDVAKIKKWETYYWRVADKVIAMSEADKEIMKTEILSRDIDVVPNGVDTELFFNIKNIRFKKKPFCFWEILNGFKIKKQLDI